jgi:hypothetical protein
MQLPISKTIGVSLAMALVCLARPTAAAEIRLDPAGFLVSTNERFTMTVTLDTAGETINAVEGRLLFPDAAVEVSRITDGGSVIVLWLERPTVQGSSIAFSGIVPGGFAGESGELFSVTFRGRAPGEGTVELTDQRVLLNDGQGTETAVSANSASIAVSSATVPTTPMAPGSDPADRPDRQPPEPFEPRLIQDPNQFAGQWFLVFVAEDKGSGIGRYEVCEGDLGCRPAESPYVLRDQRLVGELSVKAYDRQGNIRLVRVRGSGEARPAFGLLDWLKPWRVFAILLVLVALSYLIRLKWRKHLQS